MFKEHGGKENIPLLKRALIEAFAQCKVEYDRETNKKAKDRHLGRLIQLTRAINTAGANKRASLDDVFDDAPESQVALE